MGPTTEAFRICKGLMNMDLLGSVRSSCMQRGTRHCFIIGSTRRRYTRHDSRLEPQTAADMANARRMRGADSDILTALRKSLALLDQTLRQASSAFFCIRLKDAAAVRPHGVWVAVKKYCPLLDPLNTRCRIILRPQ